MYLSAIADLYDRYPIAYVISLRNDNRLVFKTFDKATAAFLDARPIFHPDRRFQYTSKIFKKKLEKQEMEQSMSREGHCIDNGPTEGFWGNHEIRNVSDVRDNGRGFTKTCDLRLSAFLQRRTSARQISLQNTIRSASRSTGF